MHGALTARIVPFPSGDTGTGKSRKGLEACSGQRVVQEPYPAGCAITDLREATGT
jgi:hypothetical protein